MDCTGISALSDWFSILSLGSWMCAQLPQIYTNYTNKSADGISPSFLGLWFMGDFLSFVSCIMNNTLKFQIYLSLFFIANDIMLCFQYYYYNSVYPRINYKVVDDIQSEPDTDVENITTATSVHSDYSIGKLAVAASLVGNANALIISRGESAEPGIEPLGLILAWACTAVYISSRCPQLYKNYQRKSVEGINPILFASALVGNLTYTLSILTSCDFISNDTKSAFLFKELPYILGSSGTVIFDILYFYQRYLYRNAGQNTHLMDLENWQPLD